jgi:alpha-tubulin suppressor-like RCC1 family protein
MKHQLYPYLISCIIVSVIVMIINFTYLNSNSLYVDFTESTISSGRTYSCLINYGKVYCWGETTQTRIENISNALYVATADEALCVVTTQKTVHCVSYGSPVQIPEITTAVGIWARKDSICVKLESGQAQCLGSHQTLSEFPQLLPRIQDFNTIKPGHNTLLCATRGMTKNLHCAGSNDAGELGNGGFVEVLSFDFEPILTHVHHFEISYGYQFMCAIYGPGHKLACWGTNTRKAMGGVESEYLTPHDVPGVVNAHSVAIAEDTTCVLLKTHEVVCFGDHTFGQFGSGALYGPDNGNTPHPQYVYSLTDVVELTAGRNHFCCKTKYNRFYCWGRNNYGQLGYGISEKTVNPILSQAGVGTLIIGGSTTCLYEMQNVKCFGFIENIGFKDMSTYRSIYRNAMVYKQDTSLVVKMTNAGNYICFLLNTGQIMCEGVNYAGQLGTGNTTHPIAGPVIVYQIENAVDVCSSNYFSCAVLSTGRTTCWGLFLSIENSLSNAVNVTCGYEFVCFKLQNNSLACAGDNTFGEVGDGTTSTQRDLVIVSTDVFGVAPSGYFHNCLIDSDKLLHCSGDNQFGQLGVDFPSMQLGFDDVVSGITDAVKVVTGGGFTCVLEELGIAYCFGANTYGQLGSGDYLNSHVPIRINTEKFIVDISAGEFHMCFKTEDGKNYCQGRNDKLQLGGGGVYELPYELLI